MRSVVVLFVGACLALGVNGELDLTISALKIETDTHTDCGLIVIAPVFIADVTMPRGYFPMEDVPYITPCTAKDQACLKSSAQKAVPVLAAGIPAFGMDSMDPMLINRVKANQVGLEMDFRNTVIKGMRNCDVLGVKRTSSKIFIDMKCSVTLVGDYKLGGKLLVLDVEGEGKYKIKIRDIVLKVVFDAVEKVRDGAKYWYLESYKYTSDVQGNAEFRFQNLFHGDKMLSDTIHEFANTNWKEITQEISPPMVKAIMDRIYSETKKFFNNVPVSQLTLN